jgi:hypothetical protein
MSHGVNFLSAHDDQGMMAFREQTPSRDEEAYEQLLGQVGNKAALTILQEGYKDKEKKGNKMRVFQMVQNAKNVLGDNRFDDKVKFPVRKLLESLNARYDDAETRIGGEVTLTADALSGRPKATPLPLDSWDEEVIPPAKPVVQKAAQAASASAAPNLDSVLAACTRANVVATLRTSALPNAATLAGVAQDCLDYLRRAENDPRWAGEARQAAIAEAIDVVRDPTLHAWFTAQLR